MTCSLIWNVIKIIDLCTCIFVALQESLSGMTSSQFDGIIDRLTTFTSQNLKKLISHMNLDAFFDNVDKVAVSLIDFNVAKKEIYQLITKNTKTKTITKKICKLERWLM